MIKRQYNKTLDWIARKRFHLLLFCTIMVLILPAFSGPGSLSNLLFWVTITFLFLQSLVAANLKRSRKNVARIIVVGLILITWLKPVGIDSIIIEIIKTAAFAAFFIFVVYYLFRFIRQAKDASMDVLITAINIYLLIGIVGASIASLLEKLYPDAYNLPAHLNPDKMISFFYYSFITMSTVGYGDITPTIPETQALAYFLAITGQLYVAIIIAFIIGKFMAQTNKEEDLSNSNSNDQQ
jgi:voltage-gated potassium channel